MSRPAEAGERPIFLVGFMGSGKSSVAEALARRLGWDKVDTDALVEHGAGRPIEAIFRDAGEGAFRRLEWEALTGLDGRTRCVVATGGGLFAGAGQRRWIRDRGLSVWLDVPLEECRRRVGGQPGRPLWAAGDPPALRALFEKRRAAYALADLRIAGTASAAETAERVLARLSGAGRP